MPLNNKNPPWCVVCEQPLHPQFNFGIVLLKDNIPSEEYNVHLDCVPAACNLFVPPAMWSEVMNAYIMACNERLIRVIYYGDREVENG